MDFEQAPDSFGYVVFDRTDRAADARRFYMIAWQSTLLDDGAVVRTFGRKGRWKRVITTPFPSLQAAWPFTPALHLRFVQVQVSGRRSRLACATATARPVRPCRRIVESGRWRQA